MHNSQYSLEERIDVDLSDWMHQKNQILALKVTCRIQFVAIIMLAVALGFLMFAQPHLDALPYMKVLLN
jgi:hypothetical protein